MICKDAMLPLTYAAWDVIEEFAIQFYEVRFLEDFGPVTKGSKFDIVCVNYAEGLVEIFEPSDDEEADPVTLYTIQLKYIVDETWEGEKSNG